MYVLYILYRSRWCTLLNFSEHVPLVPEKEVFHLLGTMLYYMIYTQSCYCL